MKGRFIINKNTRKKKCSFRFSGFRELGGIRLILRWKLGFFNSGIDSTSYCSHNVMRNHLLAPSPC